MHRPLGPKPFQTLKEEFELPNRMLFRYLQLHHALCGPFPDIISTLQSSPPIDIHGSELTKLISALYNALHIPAATSIADRVKSTLESVVVSLEDVEWDEELVRHQTSLT